ncbi:natterin-3-like [Apteryx mantelli]|uniref:Natterin-3-like n=1 Tax=Apteryx mantelli TaxID=2696672 RepID=A0ABM4FZK0_9AVES
MMGRKPFSLPAAGLSQAGSHAPRRKRENQPSAYLKWVVFEGRLPAYAVSNWNDYAKRLEYICSTPERKCNTGVYVPSRGEFCFFPYGGWEHRVSTFKLLVNEGNFEALKWVDASFGAIPENAVEGCPKVDVFVGRNQYGLGKIPKTHRAFFVVIDGEEVWYKWYQVLTVKKGPADITISDVRYNMSGAAGSQEDITLTTATVSNDGCQRVKKSITLEGAAETEHDWKADQVLLADVRGMLRAGVLAFKGTEWEVSTCIDIAWIGGASTSRYFVHNHTAEVEVLPKMACTVALEGRRVIARVPFAAQLTRDFGDGELHRTAVTGLSESQEVTDVRAGMKQCWPIPKALPCQA